MVLPRFASGTNTPGIAARASLDFPLQTDFPHTVGKTVTEALCSDYACSLRFLYIFFYGVQ